MPVVRCSEAASAIVTHALVPLNDRAPPTLPAAVHVALESVPVLLCPEASRVCTPLPSLNPYAATRPDGDGEAFDTVTATVAVARLPAASRATAPTVCEPFDVVVVFHVIAYGDATRSVPSAAPSSWNCTPATPTLSDAVAVMDTEAETVA